MIEIDGEQPTHPSICKGSSLPHRSPTDPSQIFTCCIVCRLLLLLLLKAVLVPLRHDVEAGQDIKDDLHLANEAGPEQVHRQRLTELDVCAVEDASRTPSGHLLHHPGEFEELNIVTKGST